MRIKPFNILFSLAACNTMAVLSLAEPNSAPDLSSANAPAVAWSAGALRINGADHTGSGNVLPGGRLEMLRASGQLYLADGTRMRLSAATRMTVDKQSVNLERGVARVDSPSSANLPLHIAAGELQVTASGGTVDRTSLDQLIVTAATKPTEVRRSNGVLVAMVRPGETLAFTVAKSGANAAATVTMTRLTGKVSGAGKHYFLTDEVTGLRTELQGGKPASYKDQRVQACGELVNAEKETRALVVKEYTKLDGQSKGSGTCGLDPAAAAAVVAAGGAAAGTAAAGTAAAAGAVAGVSTAVVAGVVVATVAAVATSVALVNAEGDAKAISQ